MSPPRQCEMPHLLHDLVLFGERFHTARRKIRETTIQRGERVLAERRPVFIGGVAEDQEPCMRKLRLVLRQLIHELVQRFARRHAWASLLFIITPPRFS